MHIVFVYVRNSAGKFEPMITSLVQTLGLTTSAWLLVRKSCTIRLARTLTFMLSRFNTTYCDI